MTAARVNVSENDLSATVAPPSGVTGAMLIPSLKGAVGQPFLVSNETQLLNIFTPDQTVDVGMSLAFYSALAFLSKSSALWVVRVADTALFGGASFKTSSSSYDNISFPAGVANPAAYVFDGFPDAPAVAQQTQFVFSQTGSFYDVSGPGLAIQLYDSPAVGYYFWFSVAGGSNSQTDPGLAGMGEMVTISQGDSATAAQIATAFYTAVAAVSAHFTATNTPAGTVTVTNHTAGALTSADSVTGSAAALTVLVPGADAINLDDECLALFGNTPGAYNNNVGVEIVTDPTIVKQANAFLIYVYANGNASTPVETWTVSRTPGALDGFGNNMYIEDRLQGSNYIQALSNPAITSSVMPKAQLTILYLAGGSDGVAVTDSDMVSALDSLSNPDDIHYQLFMDGGWATPALALAADTMVSNRQDAVSINSVPIGAEQENAYLTAILLYRNSTLSLNSSYSALYTPHLLITDKYNNRTLYVAPDGYAGAAISLSASNYEIWFPPAGNKRGVLNVQDVLVRFTEGDLDQLTDAQVNPIRYKPGKGIVIWGQSTLQSSPSMLQNLNVRLLLITIEPAIKAALEDFLFDLDDTSTWILVKAIIDRYMTGIQAGQGVSSFLTVCDNTNNSDQDISNGILNVDLFIIPIGSVNQINARVTITNAGVSFATLNV